MLRPTRALLRAAGSEFMQRTAQRLVAAVLAVVLRIILAVVLGIVLVVVLALGLVAYGYFHSKYRLMNISDGKFAGTEVSAEGD